MSFLKQRLRYVRSNCYTKCLKSQPPLQSIILQTSFEYSCSGNGRHLARTTGSRYLSSSERSRESIKSVSNGPRAILDLRSIRNDIPKHVENCRARNYLHLLRAPQRLADLWAECKPLEQKLNDFRVDAKGIQRRLKYEKLDSAQRDSLIVQAKLLKDQATEISSQLDSINEQIHELAVQLPNLTSQQSPVGHKPSELNHLNNHIRKFQKTSQISPQSHVEIGDRLDLLDFGAANASSGWGWYFLKNEAALLEQALIQYALSVATSHGWQPVTPPSIVYSHIVSACGFQPRDLNSEQQIYAIEQTDLDSLKPPRALAATAEIPFAGMHAHHTFTPKSLPLKVVGPSRCYRAEAGARGAASKGLYRVHEFTKVEMFAWTEPDASDAMFDELVAIQKHILTALDIPCRILEMPTGDLGASASRKIDIEAWFPSRKDRNDGWGEVSSASICTDYQARRLLTRYKLANGQSSGWPHTVNGTAIAIPRVLAAILENGLQMDGSVTLPRVLRPWMNGIEAIQSKL